MPWFEPRALFRFLLSLLPTPLRGSAETCVNTVSLLLHTFFPTLPFHPRCRSIISIFCGLPNKIFSKTLLPPTELACLRTKGPIIVICRPGVLYGHHYAVFAFDNLSELVKGIVISFILSIFYRM